MLLTIHNLPINVRYNDVKLLLQEKCGFTDMILDNLMNEGNTAKKVTVGLADEGDAAILVRKINGIFVNGQQLFVEDIKKRGKEQPYYKGATRSTEFEEPKSYSGNTVVPGFSHSDSNTGDYNMVPGFNRSTAVENQQVMAYDQFGSKYVQHDQMVMNASMMGQYGMIGGVCYVPQVMDTSYMAYSGHTQAYTPVTLQTSGVQVQQEGFKNHPANQGQSNFQDNRPHKEPYRASDGDRDFNVRRTRWDKNQDGCGRRNTDSRSQSPMPNPWSRDGKNVSPSRNDYRAQTNPGSKNNGRSLLPTPNTSHKGSQNTFYKQDAGYQKSFGDQKSSYQNNRPTQRDNSFGNKPIFNQGTGYQNPETFDDQETSYQNNRDNSFGKKPFYTQESDYVNSAPADRDNTFARRDSKYGESVSYPNISTARGNTFAKKDPVQSVWNTKVLETNVSGDYQRGDNRKRFSNPQEFEEPRRKKFADDKRQESRFKPPLMQAPKPLLKEPVIPLNMRDQRPNRFNPPQQIRKPYETNKPVQQNIRFQQPGPSQKPYATVNKQPQPPLKSRNDLNPVPIRGQLTEKEQVRSENYKWQAAASITNKMLLDLNMQDTMKNDRVLKKFRGIIKKRIDTLLRNKMARSVNGTAEVYRKRYSPDNDLQFFNSSLEIIEKELGEEQEAKIEQESKEKLEELPSTSGPISTDNCELVPAPKPILKVPIANVQPHTGKLPKYPNADKTIYKQQKQLQKAEYVQDVVYELKPPLDQAHKLEMDAISQVFKDVLNSSDSVEDGKVCQRIMNSCYNPIIQMLDLNVKKRLLKIGTNLAVRIFAVGKPPKRDALEAYLKNYGVLSLKKSDRSRTIMFVATLSSFEQYDALIAEGQAIIDGFTVMFKPLNLTGPKSKERLLQKKNEKNKLTQQKNEDDWEDQDEKPNVDDLEYNLVKFEEDDAVCDEGNFENYADDENTNNDTNPHTAQDDNKDFYAIDKEEDIDTHDFHNETEMPDISDEIPEGLDDINEDDLEDY